MVKAVIFDLDGTLIDTEKYYRICWPMALKAFGYDMTDEESLSMRSLGRPFTIDHLKKMFNDPDLDYDAIRKERVRLFNEMVEREGISLKDGARECLDYLKEKGITIALATASPLDRAESLLKKVGLFEYFDRIVSAATVKEGKPAPDVYLFALKELNLTGEDCIAVEDSPNGVMSAYRAGIRVVMVPDQDEPSCDIEKQLYKKLDSLKGIRNLV